MDPNRLEARWTRAAGQLFAARKAETPGERLPEACRPTDLQAAFAIQRRVGAMLNETIGGWKSSVPGRGWATAPIYASAIHRTSPCPIVTRCGTAQAEPEIAFVLGRDLSPRAAPYSEDELCGAIAETRLALELIGSRYTEPREASFPELLADNLSNEGVFIGPLVAGGPGSVPENVPITVEASDGFSTSSPGRHPEGGPLRTFIRLAQSLAERGEALTKGQIVITGSLAGVLQLPLGTGLRVRYGELGALQVEFLFAEACNTQGAAK